MLGFIAAGAEVDWGTLEASGRRAWDTPIFLNELAQATPGICGGLLAFFFVGYIDEEFDDSAIVAFGDGVVEGVDGYAPLAQADLIELGIVDITGEAGVVPEQQCLRAGVWLFVQGHHAIEVITACSRAARSGFIYKVVAKDEAVLFAE